jgi:heme/copper-type cytochrome/quinol oxidase subunit 1
MHTLVRRFIKTAIGFLAAGLVIGGWMVARRELAASHPSPYITSAHTHAIFVGFVMMMIMGVALWLFPRPDKEDVRYSPRAVTASYWCISIGTAGRVLGELIRPVNSAWWLRWAVVAFSLMQIVGILAFFHTMWSRIRPLGSRVREEKGERF